MLCLLQLHSLHHLSLLSGLFMLLDLNCSKHLNFLEFKSSAGDGRLCVSGVVMYANNAKWGSSPPSMAFVRLFLMVCTNR